MPSARRGGGFAVPYPAGRVTSSTPEIWCSRFITSRSCCWSRMLISRWMFTNWSAPVRDWMAETRVLVVERTVEMSRMRLFRSLQTSSREVG